MKKTLTALALIAASFTATADSTTSWYTTKGGEQAVQGVRVDSGEAITTFAIIYMNHDATQRNVGFKFPTSGCDGFEDVSNPLGIIKINEINVNYSIQCIGDNLALTFPTSEAGNAFVWDQFTKMNTVTMQIPKGDAVVFSAKGFMDNARRHHAENTAL